MLTLQDSYEAFRQAALADGFSEKEDGGPWGRRQDDASVVLRKDDVVIWLVSRNVFGKEEHWTAGWFQNGNASFDVPESYSPEGLAAARGVCNYCEQGGDPARLKRIGFAGRVCPTCDTQELRSKIEFPGWYN